jgi:hypothetical protein
MQKPCSGSDTSGEVMAETEKKTGDDGFMGICAICNRTIPVFKNEFGEWTSMQHEFKAK